MLPRAFEKHQFEVGGMMLSREQNQPLIYILNKNNNRMQKVAPFSQTKGTENSFPIILSSLKQRGDDSQKTLFKNDSLSSDQGAPIPTLPKKANNASNLPQLDQIKKFLKRGQQINTQTLKKLKEDKQINELAKQDRSSASLYKTSRRLDFMPDDNPKERQIKRIYLSHKKTKSRPLFIFPVYRGRRVSQQVQTDRMDPTFAIDSKKDLGVEPNQSPKYPSFQHHLSYNTIEAIQQQFSNRPRQQPYMEIEQDMDQQRLPPNKQRKNLVARAKASSNKHNIESYMKSMGRTSFDFYNGMNRANHRYKQYKQQQTIYSKTIDTKPVLPLKQTLNTFLDTEIVKNTQQQPPNTDKQQSSNAKINIQNQQDQKKEKKSEKSTNKRQRQSSALRIEKVQSKLQQIQKKMQNFKQSMVSQPLVPFTFDKDKQFDRPSSLIAQQSQNLSPQLSSRQKASRMTQNLLNLIPASPAQKKRPSKAHSKQKASMLVQVPSMHELKIGNIQTSENHANHPIRQNFNQNQLSWVKDQYHPKHQIFKGVNLLDFQIKKYKNGVYFGQIDEEGHKNGKGIIFYYSGKIYEGELEKDMKNGKGLEIYPDGSRFKGQFSQGLKQGRGMFQWSNGEIYDGQWQNGKKNGSGMWKGAQGQSYIGEWKNGKVQGFGVYVMKNGSRYEGQFKNSLKHGVGTQRFNNGETYVGSYEKNRPNGEGQYYWANGDYYKGSFSNGLRHGQGYFKQNKSNIQYRGEYKNDKKCGYGQINYENGLVYIGNFENNYRHGFGQLTQNGALKYRGYWINDHQVDQFQSLKQSGPANKKTESRSIKKPNKPIPPIHIIKQDDLQRQESLPKPIIPQKHTKTQHNHHDHSPQGQQGYKRPCACHRKH